MLRRAALAGLTCCSILATQGLEAADAEPLPLLQTLLPRIGVLGGLYSIDSDRRGSSSGDTYGFQTGLRYGADGLIGRAKVFADLSLERSSNRAATTTAFNRTDLMTWAGTSIGRLSPFVGYRMGFQSQSENHSGLFATGLLEDDFFREGGPLIGVFSPIWNGEKLSAAATFFYNRTNVDYGAFELGRRDETQNIYSLSVTLSAKASPQSLFLIRFQRFGLSANDGEPGYDETYLHLIYQRRWTYLL